MKNPLVPAILVLILATQCLSSTDYRVGQQALLDESLTCVSAYGIESATGIASSGSMYFVTWMGMRGWAGGRIFGTRISQDGTVLDPAGIHFTPHSYYTGRPSVCWNGSSFFVVYGDGRLEGVRVNTDGTVLDSSPILITNGDANPTAVGWDGTNHVVVWEDSSGTSSDVLAARVNASGVRLDATPIPISTCATEESSPQIASSPYGLSLIVWRDYRNQSTTSYDIYGAVVNSSGTVISPADGIPICTLTGSDSSPSVCWTGDFFQVAWSYAAPTASRANTIMDIRVSSTGALIDPAPIIVSSGTEYRSVPRIACNGSTTLITWNQQTSSDTATRDIWGGMVDNCGQPISLDGFPIGELAGSQGNALISSAGTEFLSVWYDTSLGGIHAKLCGDRISNAGVLIPSTIDIATAPPFQEFPSVAFSGQDYMACWLEYRNGERCVYGALLDEYIEKPDPRPAFCIDPEVVLSKWNDPSWAQVVWNGQDYVVLWADGSYHKVMRVGRDGTIRDPGSIVVGDNAGVQMKSLPGFTSDGTNCLIVQQIGQYLRTVLLARDGSILADRQIEDLGSTSATSAVRAYWTGQVYVLLKQNNMIQVLDRNANPVSSYAVPLVGYLAVGRTNCLMVWNEGKTVKSRRIGLDGALIDMTSTTVATGFYDSQSPSVSWDGKHYLIFFMNFASAGSQNYDFDLVRVTEDNTVVDAAPLKFAGSRWDVGWWAVPCAGPKGKTLAVYTEWEPAPYNIMRMKGQFFYSYIDLTGVREALDLDDGTYVNVAGEVATAAFPVDNWEYNQFYLQDDRTCGIRVNDNAGGVSAGDSVSFWGIMSGWQGERMIVTPEVDILSHGNPIPDPLGMSLKNLGGTPPNSCIESIDGASGAYNVCMRVKVWGTVTYTSADYFYIDDGSNPNDGSGHIGVKVYVPFSYLPPNVDDLVRVTGISGAEESGGRIIRVVRAKDFVKL